MAETEDKAPKPPRKDAQARRAAALKRNLARRKAAKRGDETEGA